MGENTISTIATPIVKKTHIDQYATALKGDVVPRNASGVPVSLAGSLGTQLLQWDQVWTDRIFINGSEFVPTSDETANAIVSGASTANSAQPLFLQADGSTNACKILGAATTLSLTINSSAVNYTTDVSIPALTQAPASNNTCLVNESRLSGQNATKILTQIPIDTVGSEITSRNGQIAAFQISTEIFLAQVDTTNGYLNVLHRGFFFNASQSALSRVTVSNNATITLLSLCYIFADGSGTTGTFTSAPLTYSDTEPTSPSSNDYWFDTSANEWKRYNGSVWQGSAESVNRLLIGFCVVGTSVAAASRCLDFSKTFTGVNTMRLSKSSATVMITDRDQNEIDVYGTIFKTFGKTSWDITADRDTGVSESANTTYYFYFKDDGGVVISNVEPNYYENRRGGYHPFETWRFIGSSLNDGSSNLSRSENYVAGDVLIFNALGAILNPHGLNYNAIMVGGGGGGGSAGSTPGNGTDTYIAYSDALAGGGDRGGSASGNGGTYSGGDFGIDGDDNDVASTAGGVNQAITYNDIALLSGNTAAGSGGVGEGTNNTGGGAGAAVFDNIVNRKHGFAYVGAGGAVGGSSPSSEPGEDGIIIISYYGN